jgi:hypothetical protein
MALQRIASVAKILRKGAIVMLLGRSQRNENLQGDECILQQISALRRENRFLKVGLIFCLVLSTLPYLTGFQPTVIRASKVVTERVEFVKDGKTTMSIAAQTIPTGGRLDIEDEDGLPMVVIGSVKAGRGMFVIDKRGKPSVGITLMPNGDGTIGVYNRNGEPVAGIGAGENGDGEIDVFKNGKLVARMHANEDGGAISVRNRNGLPIAIMGAGENGDGGIFVYNRSGHPVATMSASVIGGGIVICDKEGNILASMIATPLWGAIELKTPSGRTVWSAP